LKQINKKNLSLLIEKPFIVFEINNFLENDRYQKLLDNFPKDSLFKNFSSQGAVIDPEDEVFKKEIITNETWKKFFEELNSEKFVSSAYYFSLFSNIKSRGISALKKWTIKDNYLKIFFRKVKVETYFTILKANNLLHPHTDAQSKLISTILYFDDNRNSMPDAGTEFWENNKDREKWQNWQNKHLNNEEEISQFTKSNNIFHKSKFEKNKLVGFIKTAYSWHSILNPNIKDSQTRKALVINIRY